MNKSRIQSAKILSAALGLVWGMSMSDEARAQITGELVEPDVMLLIDSSGSMDWLRETGQRDAGQWDWSRKVCVDPRLSTDPSTAWQKVQDAFLGSAGADGRCSVEPYYMRPNMAGLDSDLWTSQSYLDDGDGDGAPDYIEEFRISNRPHFRRVNCPEENWHKHPDGEMYQCIKLITDDNYIGDPADPNFDPDVDGVYTTVSYFTAREEQKIYCRVADVVGGMCWNYHPAARDRLSNGILTRYSSMARFGVMTYDNKPNCLTGTPSAPCAPHATWWDYGDSRVWSEYLTGGYWNAGARSDHPAAVGGLVRIGLNADATNQRVRDVFETMEPLNCSPIAALVDDAGYYLATDPYVRPFDMTVTKKDTLVSSADYSGKDRYYKCRPKVVVMVTDGDPGAFEWAAGSCNVTNTDDDWDPFNTNAATTVFDCPWRSTPEEAWELFDVGTRTLDQLLADLGEVRAEEDQPVYLIVVGFNVTEDCADVDCEAVDPACTERLAKCADCTCVLTGDPVADAACEAKRSRCIEYTSGYNDKACYIELCPEGETCLMTPREFLNEVACQGWPWNTPIPSGAGGHLAELPPPWLDPDLDAEDAVCADPTPTNPYPICTLTRGDKTKTKGDRALFVFDSNELATVLDMVIGSLSSTVATRTDVVTWNVPTVAGPGVWPGVVEIAGQYEFNSGYVAKQGRPWQGILSRTPYKCTDGVAAAEKGTPSNIGSQLENQSERDLFVVDEEEIDEEDYSVQLTGAANAEQWIETNLLELVKLDSSQLDDCDFADSEVAGFCADNHELQNSVARFMEDRGLADIFNSTPSVLGPPTDRLGISSHDLFRTDNAARHPFLFVGTNDGVMHAFDITQMQDNENGNLRVEAFGYVPRVLLPQLWRQYPIDIDRNESGYDIRTDEEAGLYQHLFLMDGSPVTRDVLLFRDPTTNNPAQEKKFWRSIVLGGLGKGGRGYYALDVTGKLSSSNAPTSANMLRWELSPGAKMWGNNDDDAKAALLEMGYPLAKPAIAYVTYQIAQNTTAQVAAAILPGGWKSDGSPDSNTGVYIVRLADGKLIRYLRPGALGDADMCESSSAGLKEDPDDEDAVIESAQLLGEPVIPFGADMITSTNEAFIGDDRGRLWRIDMTDTDPEKWCLSIFFDSMLAWDYPYEDCDLSCTPPEGQSCCSPSDICHHEDCCTGFTQGKSCAVDPDAPTNMDAPRTMIVGAPTIAENKEGKNVIVFGTGQYDGLSSWNRNRIFSVTHDTESVELEAEDTDTPTTTVKVPVINWWIGDDLVAVGDEDWTPWHVQVRAKLAAKQVKHDFTGISGESFWNIGEKLVGAPVVFNEVAYFTTFVPIESADLKDACEAGGSRIWGVDFNRQKGPNGVAETSFEEDDFGRFTDENGEHSMFRWFPDELLSGVRVVSRPRCTEGFDTDVFELAVQKAQKDFKQYDNKQVPSDAIQTQREPLAQGGNLLEISILRFDSWAIIFE